MENIVSLTYEDNQALIDIFTQFPNGIFDLTDESCQLAKQTDQNVLSKIIKEHQQSSRYFQIEKITQNDYFSICHSAMTVKYNINGFRQKNMDTISKDINILVRASHNQDLKDIWSINIQESSTYSNGSNY